MTTEITTASRPLSTQLVELFSHINNMWGNTVQLIDKAYNLAKQEGRTPEEAKQLVFDNVTFLSKSQIYRALPDECKDSTKQKAGSVSHKEGVSVPNLEQNFNTEGMGVVTMMDDDEEPSSSSASATGPDGKEVEVEQYTAPSLTGGEIVKISKVEYEELREAARPQPTKASELPRDSRTTTVLHDRILEIFVVCKQTQGNNKNLEFTWTDEGNFVRVTAVESYDLSKTKQENTEASH